MKKDINNIIKNKIVILDGACGTQLQQKGMPQGVAVELWCLENPQVLDQIHKDYQLAGSDIVYTCTFGANRYKLGQYGVNDVKEVNRKLAVLARKAVGANTLVAGDIGPTGTFIEPFGSLGFEEAVKIFKEQVEGLCLGGVDLIVIETMLDIQEARAALIAVKEVTNKFTIVTMTFEKDGRSLNGTDPISGLITLQSLGADAFGCNCSTGPEQMLEFIKLIKPYAKIPLVAKPNSGLPTIVEGKTIFDMSAQKFASYAKSFVKAGVNFLGGCCGTSPEHIKNIKSNLKNTKPILPFPKAISAFSSARDSIILTQDSPLLIVGERINPTGKKELQAELKANQTTLIRQLAKEQESLGAKLLDVNVGLNGINEVASLRSAVCALAMSTSLPLVLDSSNIDAIEAGLRIYPGRALINSLSGEEKKLKKLLPIAKKYGAMIIVLPVNDKGVPETFSQRIKIIQDIYKKIEKFKIAKEDIIIDVIAMTISSHPKAALESLKLITWCKDVFNCPTIMGISNVSFGLPNREVINATYLGIARAYGLSMVIANPLQEKLRQIKYASDALLNKDKDLSDFITYFNKEQIKKESGLPALLPGQQKIFDAILEGRREDVQDYLKLAIADNLTVDDLINKVMIVAINKVGELFEKKQFFLPQLIASAETMKIGMQYLRPYMKKDQQNIYEKKIVVILATVKGDVHDIGKNIVGLILENHGFKVIDLGKDVSAKRIIQEIKKYDWPIVGLSALMTTTMVNMKEVVELAKKENLQCSFIIGGAVVSNTYANSLGVHYAGNGVEAVAIIKKIKK